MDDGNKACCSLVAKSSSTTSWAFIFSCWTLLGLNLAKSFSLKVIEPTYKPSYSKSILLPGVLSLLYQNSSAMFLNPLLLLYIHIMDLD
ncbi:uncharacterized protein BYT42DRAFT_251168 [Radiomyces spectabilis]|uniref:uncharacterized protein n=1 Tax=Radiomyces spectabilis TaxID=64574 RepID=UPI00221F3567|nr:uncharacterized protein BYT42DRAFT_251168 [Radiomyces spectabilis]KAI8388890.1 hypothetical protein BYT42DRAFT_251168 [Radiomyces spectabilis]